MNTAFPLPRIPHYFYRLLAIFVMLINFSALAVCEPSLAAQEDKERWNKKYDTEKYLFGRDPIPFVKDHIALLPKGKALDLAMGEGRNGVYLATQGFRVTGVDISEGGLKKAQTLAAENNVIIETVVADLEQLPFRDIETHEFDPGELDRIERSKVCRAGFWTRRTSASSR